MFGLFGNKEEVNYKELVKQGAIILDVRSNVEFNSGHVKGSINIPVDILSTQLQKLGNDKSKYIITCCASGGRSGVAKQLLHSAGYNNVHNGGGWHSLQSKLS